MLRPKHFLRRLFYSMVVLAGTGALPSYAANAAANDPLYPYQWHLKNTGQPVFADIRPTPGIDLDMGTLFEQGITGKGVVVGFVEDGPPESQHEDLQPNMLRQGADKPPIAHATATASIIAAVAGNGKGGRGIAPDAKIFVLKPNELGHLPIALRLVSLSAGGSPPLFLPNTNSPLDDKKLNDPDATLVVQAAGNSFLEWDPQQPQTQKYCEQATQNSGVGCVVANTNPLSGSPTTIAVGAVNAAGKKSSYASTGSVLWVSGLGGEYGWQREYRLKQGALPEKAQRHPEHYFAPAIVSADLSGCDKGLNQNGHSYNALDSGSQSPIDATCRYTALANGTSSAAPMVAGVIALMLQVNPKLSWRDIKYILATTARKVDAHRSDVRWHGLVLDSGWVKNAAGHFFSNWYGFGLVDATKAVNMARHYVSLPPLQTTDWQTYTGAPVPIPYRHSASNSGLASIEVGSDLAVEMVQLQLKTTSQNPNHLRITLISPAGTRSIIVPGLTFLVPRPQGFSIDLTASNAFLNEKARGVWKLQIVDLLNPASSTEQELTSWKLRILGHRSRAYSDVYRGH